MLSRGDAQAEAVRKQLPQSISKLAAAASRNASFHCTACLQRWCTGCREVAAASAGLHDKPVASQPALTGVCGRKLGHIVHLALHSDPGAAGVITFGG